jgi:hypothetical protein
MKLVIARMTPVTAAMVVGVTASVEADIIFNAVSRPRRSKSRSWKPTWQNSNSKSRPLRNTWLT